MDTKTADYDYGCYSCEWWDSGRWEIGHDFGNCPICGERKTVWNQTDAEAPIDHEQALEDSLDEILC